MHKKQRSVSLYKQIVASKMFDKHEKFLRMRQLFAVMRVSIFRFAPNINKQNRRKSTIRLTKGGGLSTGFCIFFNLRKRKPLTALFVYVTLGCYGLSPVAKNRLDRAAASFMVEKCFLQSQQKKPLTRSLPACAIKTVKVNVEHSFGHPCVKFY